MRVEIENLEFKCIIGILDFERTTKQKVVVNLSFDYDFKDNHFIDYAEVTSFVKDSMKKNRFKLIEEAILYLENSLYKRYEISNLKLKISKPTILKDCIVSVAS